MKRFVAVSRDNGVVDGNLANMGQQFTGTRRLLVHLTHDPLTHYQL